MSIYDDLERVKLRFIAVCETLLNKGQLSEENFEQILELLDNLDDYDQEQLNSRLNELTGGKLDLMFWQKDPISE